LLTLDHHGLLASRSGHEEVFLGVALIEYGRAVLNGFDIQHAAKPSLKALAQYSGESTAVAILRGTRMTLAEVEESAAQVRISLTVGYDDFGDGNISRRAVLAHLPEDQLDEILRIEGLAKNTKNPLQIRTLPDGFGRSASRL
jgi:DNA-binding IclR family transcriptional regulator